MENKKDAEGRAIIELAKPIKIDGVSVSSLAMREPTVGDQLAVDKIDGDAAKELAMIANLCMLKPTDLHQLGLHDYRKVQKAFLGFLD